MAVSCFVSHADRSIPIHVLDQSDWVGFLNKQSQWHQTWIRSQWQDAIPTGALRVPNPQSGQVEAIWWVCHQDDFWRAAGLYDELSPGDHHLVHPEHDVTLSFALAAYRYRQPLDEPKPRLLVASQSDPIWAEALCWVRDLINTPAEQMGPQTLAKEARALERFGASVEVITGSALWQRGLRCIATVGRASPRPPCLIELRWGQAQHPRLTLIGKGVCFDTGGLNLKPGDGMRWMKKDMGGAAHVLGLAQLIMALQLPIALQVLIPAADNAVDGSAYRPGDVIETFSGRSIEIDNTDAEGRLLLADALEYAQAYQPHRIIDLATLTGAARVALGPEIPAVFSQHIDDIDDLIDGSLTVADPLWRLPLYQPYRRLFEQSQVADGCNSGSSRYAGAITAALFLQQFVGSSQAWCHIDLMAWNVSAMPGRPEGGEAMGLRALLPWLQQWAEAG